MSWSNYSIDYPAVRNYQQAVDCYDTRKPWRGEHDCGLERPLDGRRRRHSTVRVDTLTGAVMFRLYRTDVVTYHKDGTITVDPYPSASTDAFANPLLPTDLTPFFKQGALALGSFWWSSEPDERPAMLCADGSAKITLRKTKAGWRPVNKGKGLPCFTWNELDKAKAREISKRYRFADFKTWLRTYAKLNPEQYMAADPDTGRSDWEILRALAQGNFSEAVPPTFPDYWDRTRPTVASRLKAHLNEVEDLRLAAYKLEGATYAKTALMVPYHIWDNRINRNRY